uniref:Uncharacterized protein n=1 Tax=Tanacetum cinerariifolium TaxID=118510 RepID=A0A6L2JV82_TANCI|nr:hypothetical protein [Tanacetum cinerariifolium]
MLKVSPWKGVIRFGKRGKLNPRYIGTFKVLAKVGTVAYRLELSQRLSMVYCTFHVSNLKKCLSDEPLALSLNEIHIDDKLHFVEEPVKIMDREVKRLKQSRNPIIKVRWNSKRGPEFTCENYAPWEVIVNGDSPPPKRTVDGVEQTYPTTTVEEKLARKNELKARVMEAIENRFGGNKESMKTHKTLLKQQYENFNRSSSKGLDQTYDRLQKKLKQKRSSSSSQNSQNVAFVSSNSSSSTNQAHGSNSTNIDSLSDFVIYSFFVNQSNRTQLDNEDLQQTDADDLEEMNLKWQMAILTMRARRFLKKTGRKVGANGSETIGENRNREPVRRNVIVETTDAKALVAQDEIWYNWSDQAEDGPTNFVLMAYTSSGSLSSSSSDSKVSTCLKACLKSYETLKEHYDNLSKDYKKSQLNVGAYKTGLESVEARQVVYKKNEDIFEENIKIIKLDIHLRDNALTELRKKLEKAEKERDEIKITLKKFKNSSKTLNKIVPAVATNKAKTSELKPKYVSEPLMEDWISDSDDENETMSKSKQGKPSFAKVEFVKPNEQVKSPRESIKQEEHNRQAKHPRKNSQSPRDTECVVLSPDFKLLDESQVLLRVPRKNNMYNVDLKNVAPSGGLTCLFAKATLDESNLWHRRLRHINFKTINKLVKENLEEKMDTEGPGNEESEALVTEDPRVNQEKDSVNSTNRVNVVSPTVNAASNEANAVGRKSSIELLDDLNMPDLEDVSIFEDSKEDVFGVEVDLNNMETTFQISLIPTTRIYKDHSVEQIVGDIHSAPQTRRMTKSVTHHEPKKVIQALTDPSWIKIYRNKKDERGIVVRNKARQIAQGYTQEEGIDYDEVFTPVARIKVIRLFLAYSSFKDFFVYQMDVKSAFLYGKIEEEGYVYQPPRVTGDILLVQVYVDDIIFGSTRKEMCTEFEKMMHKKFQISSMGELTFFLGLQVTQKDDGIFISQDKYVDEILKKFGFLTIKTTSTPMETSKPLIKDENAKDVDVYLYRSMIGSLMYLTSSRLDIMFAILKRSTYIRPLYPKDSLFDLEAYNDSDYAGASLDRKSTIEEYVAVANCCGQVTAKAKNINGKEQIHAKVDGKKVIISEATIIRDLKFKDEGGVDCLSNEVIFEQPPLMGSTMASAIICLAINQKFNFYKYIFDSMKQKPKKSKQKDTQKTQPSYPTYEALNEKNVHAQSNDPPLSRVNTLKSGEDGLKLQELMELCTNLSERVLNLETIKTAQAKKILSLKRRVKRLEKKKKSGTHRLKRLYKIGLSARVESSAEEQREVDDQEMFDTYVFNDEEVVVEDITTATTTAVSIDDTTLAQALVEIKTSKTKSRGIIRQEPSETLTTTTILISLKVQDKGKGIMVEEPLKMKKKDQISFDEQEARRLQDEIDEQDRLAEEKEKAQLIEDEHLAWDNVQAMMDADY